ncbi:peptidylprolyl isomerase [Fulvimonas sp. R45]|uniref:peptidylprolyl isomerase n=1 Tax=Fulvimonas sp. R45 TaxID=3045937 RepID=UPI00265FF820|nr:peptidylprolyl isomerase [Fulvimonas sp. R45]MDO1529441.1 peptidylprolyl isomerase [Fulvimonas sp. R45]
MSVRVNGIAVDTGDWPSDELAAVHELLRQRARELGLLDEGADAAAGSEAIEQLLAREVRVPEPTPEECRRWYDAHPERYRSGERVHARHILFQVTPGTPVPAIRAVAEAMLQELRLQPERFEARAREKSNCPSGAQGGQLGQLQRGATVPEFEQAIFAGHELGVLPKLVNTRYGFHIVAVDRRIPGEPLPFEAVAGRVARELHAAAERKALGQYVRVLAGQAELEGVELEAAASPLVQ